MKIVPVANHPKGITQVVFGRRRPTPRNPGKFKLAFPKYLSDPASLPTPPAACDYSVNAAANQILRNIFLNNRYGCCVIAGAAHSVGVWTGNAGDPFEYTDAQIIADYSAIGGFDPNNPQQTDNGCDEITALDYYCSQGFADGTKLSGYIALDGSNQNEVMLAAFLFENLYYGMELPNAWISPFPSADGFVWDVGVPDPDNGHCVMGFGYGSAGTSVDSWALKGTLTWAANGSQCSGNSGGQIYTLLSPDIIAKGQAKAPNGFDWATLQTDLQALNGRGGLAPTSGA